MSKKGIIIILIVLFLVIGIAIYNHYNFPNKVANYIKSKGYIPKTGSLYVKDDDEHPISTCDSSKTTCIGEAHYFNVGLYEYLYVKKSVINNVSINYTFTYSYKTDETTFRVNTSYQNGSLILSGNYNANEEFTCGIEYTYGYDKVNDQNYCSTIKEEVVDFDKSADMLIQSTSLLKKMKKRG